MCPLWPAHYLFMYAVMFGFVWLASFQIVGAAVKKADQYEIMFEPNSLSKLLMDETLPVNVSHEIS